MQVVYARCAGLDVHKKSVVVCVRLVTADGSISTHIRSFGATTTALLDLVAWLLSLQVTHVAMESTGEFWKPVFNLLESHFTVLVVNAAHIKNVPGRKTDVKDAEWIAELEQALRGTLEPHHAFMSTQHLALLDVFDEQIATFDTRIQQAIEDTRPPDRRGEDQVGSGEVQDQQQCAPDRAWAAQAIMEAVPGTGNRYEPLCEQQTCE